MTAKPVALAAARKRRDAVLAQLQQAKDQLESMHQLLGAILTRTGTLTFTIPELDVDPRRLVIIEMQEQGAWVVGLKDDGSKPLELDLSKQAMEEVTEAPAKSAYDEPVTISLEHGVVDYEPSIAFSLEAVTEEP